MKTYIIMLVATLSGVSVFAQNTQIIFNQYLNVKDALVNSDSKATKDHVISLQKAIELTGPFHEKKALLKATLKMAKAGDLEKQRNAFADVSSLMWKIVDNNSNITQDVYYQYCPMKKMYWISTEAAIKNPYYGSQMLTCGNVADKKVK